jgi:drug/metabolite transporter (DMT)-like permease
LRGARRGSIDFALRFGYNVKNHAEILGNPTKAGARMEAKKAGKNSLGILCCVLGATTWGVSGACSEAFFKNYPVDCSWVAAVRMLTAGIVLTAYALLRRKLDLAAILKDKKSCLQILAFSLFGLTCCQYAYLSAIQWTNSGTATVLQNLSIVLISVYICISTRTLPQKKTVFCILLALVGVWLIATGGSFRGMKVTPKGLFWGLASGVSVACYSLLAGRPVAKWGSIPVTGLGMLLGGCLLFVCMRAWRIPAGLDLRGWALLGVIILLGTIAAFTLFMKGISLVGPVKASLLSCLEPLTATTLSAFWLGSVFTWTDLLGFACVLATVLLSAL